MTRNGSCAQRSDFELGSGICRVKPRPAGPLAGLLVGAKGLILRAKSGSGGTRADQGVCPTLPKQ
jgi:hypothetical protein